MNGNTPVLVLGVTGSIAAYKAADITSRLTQSGIEVHVIMTENATKLVTPLTFMTLSRNQVLTSLWNIPEWQPAHIKLARMADLLLIAPATANILAKIAHGIADDTLSTYALSHSGPAIAAPAMNPKMWNNNATQDNCTTLKKRGVIFVGPENGHVACGEDGRGRMASVEDITKAVMDALRGCQLPRP